MTNKCLFLLEIAIETQDVEQTSVGWDLVSSGQFNLGWLGRDSSSGAGRRCSIHEESGMIHPPSRSDKWLMDHIRCRLHHCSARSPQTRRAERAASDGVPLPVGVLVSLRAVLLPLVRMAAQMETSGAVLNRLKQTGSDPEALHVVRQKELSITNFVRKSFC